MGKQPTWLETAHVGEALSCNCYQGVNVHTACCPTMCMQPVPKLRLHDGCWRPQRSKPGAVECVRPPPASSAPMTSRPPANRPELSRSKQQQPKSAKQMLIGATCCVALQHGLRHCQMTCQRSRCSSEWLTCRPQTRSWQQPCDPTPCRPSGKRLSRQHAPPPPMPPPSPQPRADRAALSHLADVLLPPALPPPSQPLTTAHGPQPPSIEHIMDSALQFREMVDATKRTLVCAVCGCYTSRAAMADSSTPINDLPNLQLLLASGERTASLPRDALTTVEHSGQRYCLHPLGVTNLGASSPRLRVCHTCMEHLTKAKPSVPPRSLVRMDTGAWPTGMLQPTLVELALVLPVSIFRRVYVMRPQGATSGASSNVTLQKQLTGHVVVSPSARPGTLAALLPRRLEDLPKEFLVSSGWARQGCRQHVVGM